MFASGITPQREMGKEKIMKEKVMRTVRDGGGRGGARRSSMIRSRPRHEGYGLQPAMVSSAAAKEGIVSTTFREHDAAYFHAYSHVGIHEEMIKDRTRTDAYRDAIFFHSDFIRDKVVVDVGCGTGILSIFCAYAGARKVYAVDASDIAVQAREVVKANGLSNVITVILGRVEEVQIDEEVDVIVSEWMGYMLLYESMLSSVICARDRWLKPGGLMLPSHATLYMAPITNADKYSESIDFWRDVYGIDMSAMLPLAKQCSFEEPCIETITAENVLSWPVVLIHWTQGLRLHTYALGLPIIQLLESTPSKTWVIFVCPLANPVAYKGRLQEPSCSNYGTSCQIKQIDCSKVTIEELETVYADFSVSSMMMGSLHGFALWFDVSFRGPMTQECDPESESSMDSTVSGEYDGMSVSGPKKKVDSTDYIILSTAPEESPTHWAQTILYVYDPIDVVQDQAISGSLTLSQSRENPRFLNIHLEYRSGDRQCVKESVMR